MPNTQLQLRRGNTAQTAIFTGAVAEVTVDTDKKTLIIHDGSTQGGIETAKRADLLVSFNAANSAGSYANSAYNQANTGTILAQAAFNKANTSNTLTSGSKTLSLNATGIITLPASSSLYDNTSVISTNTANQVIDTFSTSSYRTAKYLIQAVTYDYIHSAEILVTHNDTDVFSNTLADIQTSGPLFNIYTVINSGNVEIKVSPVFSNTTIDFVRTSLLSRVLVPGLQGDLMSISGIEDLQSITGSFDLN